MDLLTKKIVNYRNRRYCFHGFDIGFIHDSCRRFACSHSNRLVCVDSYIMRVLKVLYANTCLASRGQRRTRLFSVCANTSRNVIKIQDIKTRWDILLKKFKYNRQIHIHSQKFCVDFCEYMNFYYIQNIKFMDI